MLTMTGNERIRQAMQQKLELVFYPDPRLRQECVPVDDPADEAVRQLVDGMFEIMFASRGVGLAGPQVGVNVMLFVASPTFQQEDRGVYINPQIMSVDSNQQGEEGCLSFPGIFANVKRHNIVTIKAQGLDGQWFEQTGEELLARIFEHETDHLLGRLLVDRMGSVARLTHRRGLRELEERFDQRQD